MKLYSSLVLASFLGLMAITAGLFLTILIRRAIVQFREREFAARYKEIETALLSQLGEPGLEGALALADRYARFPHVLTDVLLNYARSLWGGERAKLAAIFDRALRTQFRSDLSSRRIVRRLRAARMIGFYADASDPAVVQGLLRDRPVVRLAAAYAIAQSPSDETVPIIFRAFATDDIANAHAYKNIFFSLQNRAENGIREALGQPLDLERLKILIEIVGAIPIGSLAAEVAAFAGHPDKEIRLRAARTLGSLSLPDMLPQLLRLAHDEAWEVVAQAVKSLGRIGSPEALDVLTESLFFPAVARPVQRQGKPSGHGRGRDRPPGPGLQTDSRRLRRRHGHDGARRRRRQGGNVKAALLASLGVFTRGVLVYFFLINVFYMLFVILSALGILRHQRRTRFLQKQEIFSSPMAKPVSIIVPAFNEEAGIIESIRSLLSLEYPQFEVIVINDGSTDSTLAGVIEAFNLKPVRRIYRKVIECKPLRGVYTSSEYPQLVLVDKENGGKADAGNAGLNIARYPLFLAIDGDSLLDRDSLLRVVRPFLEDPERVMAVGGVIRLSNGCLVKDGQMRCLRLPRNNLVRYQILEYFRAFLGGRMGMSMLGCQLIVSGAFGIFRKDVVLACGGFNPKAIGEDIDLVVRIRRHCYRKRIPHRIVFVPDPICWTEAPESWSVLARQRGRWQRGLLQTFRFYGGMVFNPRYGVVGMFALPFYLVFELLGPIVEVLGYLAFVLLIFWHKVDYPFAVLFFAVSVGLGTLLSMASILLEELSMKRYPRFRDLFILGSCGILENLYYRQFLSLVRAKAFLDYFRGRNAWGTMEKKGFERT